MSRPWPAGDGLLVRLRLVGGRLPSAALLALVSVSEEYGDGRVHLTGRANLQLRGLPAGTLDPRTLQPRTLESRVLEPRVLAAIEATGLLPSRSHELVRNMMVSPQTGLAGGRTDLRPVAADLDSLLCADPRLADLPGRFLVVLDDGRGDLLDRSCDLGLVALDDRHVQLRVGAGWGPVVPNAHVGAEIVRRAHEFLDARGTGPAAPWHVVELPRPLIASTPPDPRVPDPAPPLPYGAVPGGRHVAVPDGGLARSSAEALAAGAAELVVTPWRGVLVPEEHT